jgi:hypothetical protein
MDTTSAGRTEEGIEKSAPGSDVQGDVQNESSVMEAVIARLADLQRDLDDVKKSLGHLKSCMECIVLSSGATSVAKDLQSLDARIVHLLMPVNNVFSAEYVAGAVHSGLPSFMLQHSKGRALKDDTELPERMLSALMFSSLPTEKRSTTCTPAGRLHSDLKLLVAKLLVYNSRSRAKAITQYTGNSRAIPSVDDALCSQSETAGSGLSEQSPNIQAEWMAPGYIRSDIYEEVRKEIDGPCVNVSEARPKKRKLSHEAELKEQVSKALVKAIYPKIHAFLRTGRDQARKLFLQQLGYVFRPEAEATINFETDETGGFQDIASIQEIPQTFPRSSSEPADDAENQRMFQNIVASYNDLLVIIEYSVSVIAKTGDNTRRRVRKEINILACALNFCVCYTQCSSTSNFFRVSTETLRMVYVIALAFRGMLVQYQDARESCSRRGNTSECQKEMRALLKNWESYMPGDVVTDRILHDGILWMTPLQYEAHLPALEETRARNTDGTGDGILDVSDEELAHIEFRMQ